MPVGCSHIHCVGLVKLQGSQIANLGTLNYLDIFHDNGMDAW